MKFGFAKQDITPRVGVELCGYGPFLQRRSTAVRDRLHARAMAIECGGRKAIVVSCDLIGITKGICDEVRSRVYDATGVETDAIMVHATHTHSGPGLGCYVGWGEADAPYLLWLPRRIAQACVEAVTTLQDATLSYAEVPCEGLGINREYDRFSVPIGEMLEESWRPEKPEVTDTTCHVLKVEAGGRVLGFCAYFGCHPVTCGSQTTHIHGDYCGIAMNWLEREHAGAVGLFLQGAQGDINMCAVETCEKEAFQALDAVANRFSRAVRRGLTDTKPVVADSLSFARHDVTFSTKPWPREKLVEILAEKTAELDAHEETPESREFNMASVFCLSLRNLIGRMERGEDMQVATEVQGIRIGPLALLACPFETFRAIKEDVCAKARSTTPLVMGVTNHACGYAPDRTTEEKGGYAADMVPVMVGALPYARIHEELVQALLKLDEALQK